MPLELLFDLTLVIAFGVAASDFAHMLVISHIGAGLAGFTFATFAACRAWINFSWSARDVTGGVNVVIDALVRTL